MKTNLSKSRYGQCRIHGAVPSSRRHPVRELMIKAGILTLAIGAGIIYVTAARAQSGAPRYEADVSWPKPMPDRWVLGGLGGVCVDAQDHVFILNRQDVIEPVCRRSSSSIPQVMSSTPGAIRSVSTRGCIRAVRIRTTTSGSPARRPG